MPRKRKIRVHISIIDGEWYAMAGNNNDATRFALIPAISLCDRMNEIQKRGKPLAAKQAARKWSMLQAN